MLAGRAISRFRDLFPPIANDAALMSNVEAGTSMTPLTAGKVICHQGDACSNLALQLSRSARVFKLAESGREITLYRVDPSECCILTASCILSGRAFPAYATVEQPLDAILIPATRVVDWMASSAVRRQFLWSLLDERLADHLAIHAAQHGPELHATHSQIAAELGTSREVVSRMLKDLEQRGAPRLHRGRIEILDRAALDVSAAA